jgi:hypothetical protein
MWIGGDDVRRLEAGSYQEFATMLDQLRPGAAYAYRLVLPDGEFAFGAERFKLLLAESKRVGYDPDTVRVLFAQPEFGTPANEARVWVPEEDIGPRGPLHAGFPARESEGGAGSSGGGSSGGSAEADIDGDVVYDWDGPADVDEEYEEAAPEGEAPEGEAPEGEAPEGEAPEPEAVDSTPFRRTPHLDLAATAPLAPGSAFEVKVFCDKEAARSGETSSDVVVFGDRVTLRVWLSASDHFDVGDGRGELVLERNKSVSETLTLPVSVVAEPPPGPGRITAAFNHQGLPCGYVSRVVTLAGAEQQPEEPPSAVTAQLVVREHAKNPDIVVEITAAGDERGFSVRVITEARPDPPQSRWSLPAATPTHVAAMMQQFTTPGLSDAARRASLKGAGMTLWSAAPAEFREVFWSLIDDESAKLESILVVSEEPAFPWELLVPHRPNAKPRAPLGVEFRLGRWVGPLLTPPDRIPLRDSYTLAPWYKKPNTLAWGPGEAAWVSSHFDGKAIDPASFDGIEEFLGRGGVSLLHLICHGESPVGGTQVIRLAKETQMFAYQVGGSDVVRGAVTSAEPMVFLNACQVGRPEPALVGVDGFAAAFIAAGARCVIAPTWNVSDQIAHEFAETFYEQVLANPEEPFAAIVARLRARAYEDGGADTWAAYTFYGNPLATRG